MNLEASFYAYDDISSLPKLLELARIDLSPHSILPKF